MTAQRGPEGPQPREAPRAGILLATTQPDVDDERGGTEKPVRSDPAQVVRTPRRAARGDGRRIAPRGAAGKRQAHGSRRRSHRAHLALVGPAPVGRHGATAMEAAGGERAGDERPDAGRVGADGGSRRPDAVPRRCRAPVRARRPEAGGEASGPRRGAACWSSATTMSTAGGCWARPDSSGCARRRCARACRRSCSRTCR